MRFASAPAPLAASLLGIFLSTGLWTAFSPGLAAAVSPAAPIHVQRYAMGTMFEIVAYHDPRGEAERAIGAAMTEIERLDAVMSHYRPDSDLARLIRTAPHGPVATDPALYDVIVQSLEFSRLSRGRFDITIGPLVELWKRAYAEDTRPSDDEVAAARRCVGFEQIELTAPDRVRFRSACLRLDLGAIGKGYAVDRAMAILERAGLRNVLIDAGGSSIAARGTPPGAAGWSVRLGSGRSRTVLLTAGSLSTSQQQLVPFNATPDAFGEIVDPATAAPATGRSAVTVIAPRATVSDALSTTLLLVPREDVARVLSGFPDVSVVWTASSGEITAGYRHDRVRFSPPQ
jgi:FAD:protein FMN transferase